MVCTPSSDWRFLQSQTLHKAVWPRDLNKHFLGSSDLFSQDSDKTEDTVMDVNGPNRSVLKRIWCTYAREAHAFDQKMITTWNKTLDVRLLFVCDLQLCLVIVMLIFELSKSGIFSALVTPFIVESYKLLDFDTQSPSQPSPSFFGRDGYKVRVNAMWFSSLIFSLVAALLSIHCKQWLDGYGVRDMSTANWNRLTVLPLRLILFSQVLPVVVRRVWQKHVDWDNTWGFPQTIKSQVAY
jgi:Family of unknown function (DUF6535)